MQTTAFQATSTTQRSAFLGLAAAITFSLLALIGEVADHQVEQSLMAQAASAPVVASAGTAPRS